MKFRGHSGLGAEVEWLITWCPSLRRVPSSRRACRRVWAQPSAPLFRGQRGRRRRKCRDGTQRTL